MEPRDNWKKFINKVTCMDCLEGMKQLPDGCVDLGYIDPPWEGANKIGRNSRGYGDSHLTIPSGHEYGQLCKQWYDEARRVSKRLIVTPGVRGIAQFAPALWCVVAHKKNASGYNPWGGFNLWEPVLIYDAPIEQLTHDLIETRQFLSDKLGKLHPCPDSLDLISWILRLWSKEGDIVGDFFAGSGQMCVTAVKNGRRTIGFDTEPKYVDICNQRLAQEVLGLEERGQK